MIIYMSYMFCCTVVRVPLGELFAQAPVDQYPGIAVEAVTDSSRYFVVRIQDETGEIRVLSDLSNNPKIESFLSYCELI